MQLRRVRRSAATAGAAVALLCVLTSCSTPSTPTQTSPATTAAPTTAAPTTAAPTTAAPTTAAPTTAAPAACADVGALKSSLEALTKVKPAEDGVPALKTAIANVKTNLAPAEASASEAAPAQCGAGEDSIRRPADGGEWSDHRQP